MSTSPGSPALQLYEALYEYDAKYEHTLGFKKGARLLKLNGSNKDEFWINALSKDGSHGYVPLNYLTDIKLSDEEVLDFLGLLLNHFVKHNELSSETDEIRAYLSILYNVRSHKVQSTAQTNASPGSQVLNLHDESVEANSVPVIEKLDLQVESVTENMNSIAISDEQVRAEVSQDLNDCENEGTQFEEAVTATAVEDTDPVVDSVEENSVEVLQDLDSCASEDKEKVKIVETFGERMSEVTARNELQAVCAEDLHEALCFELVDAVRQTVDMSFSRSLTAVSAVLRILSERLQSKEVDTEGISRMASGLRSDFHTPHPAESTVDGQKLVALLEGYSETVRMLFDDPLYLQDWDDVLGKLRKGLAIVRDADPTVVRQIISIRGHDDLTTLLNLSQAKAHSAVRGTVRQIFSELCLLDSRVCDNLILSTLPFELLNDVETSIDRPSEMIGPVELLIQLVESQECLPVSLVDRVSQTAFVPTMLTVIEGLYVVLNGSDPPANAEIVIDKLVSLLMHFNMKYSENSPVVRDFGAATSGKGITQKLILLFNEPDLVEAGRKESEYTALKKFLLDICADRKAASLFYATDLQVIVDIVLRNIANFEAGDQERTYSLQLLDHLLRNTSWMETSYKLQELSPLLSNIRNEERMLGTLPPSAAVDHKIIEKILFDFPEISSGGT